MIVCVRVPVCVRVRVCVCTGAKKIQLCVQFVLVLRVNVSGSPLENKAAPQSSLLFGWMNHTVRTTYSTR